MAVTKAYEIGIVATETKLTLIPYKLKVSADNHISADYDEPVLDYAFSRPLRDKRSAKIIGHALDMENWHLRTYWSGYYANRYSEHFLKPDAPKALRDWAESLPAYVVTL